MPIAEVRPEPLAVSAAGVARLLDCSVRMIWKLATVGDLRPAFKVGNKPRWLIADVRAFIDRQRAAGGRPC